MNAKQSEVPLRSVLDELNLKKQGKARAKVSDIFPNIFPLRLNVFDLSEPTNEVLDDLSYKYPEWDAREIRQLAMFRQVHTKPDSNYTFCHCSKCQTDPIMKDAKGVFIYEAPKVKIPFRLFVDMCFSNYFILCDHCKPIRKEDIDAV